jgi:predicted RNA binding protein YcfA (HicA-like mRNA interferase family)
MSNADGLLEKARNSPNNIKFDELCSLAESFGYVFKRQNGSHQVYAHPDSGSIMNFQSDKGKAKPYQVRQLLKAINLKEPDTEE